MEEPPIRTYDDLTKEEHLELEEKIRQAVARGDAPAKAPNVFEFVMRNEVIRNVYRFPKPEKKTLLARFFGLFRRD